MIELTNADLLGRLRSGEDHFTERKPFKDQDGWLRTAVAFANSAPIDWPAILFVGVTDSGEIQESLTNLDELQKKLSNQVSRAYPPIYHLPKIVTDEQGRQCLAVLIPGSADRPHFSGKSYIRVGSQSPEASEEQFGELIAQRSSKVRRILEWKDKTVTLEVFPRNSSGKRRNNARVIACDEFFVTLEVDEGKTRAKSYPLTKIDLGMDGPPLDRLCIWHDE